MALRRLGTVHGRLRATRWRRTPIQESAWLASHPKHRRVCRARAPCTRTVAENVPLVGWDVAITEEAGTCCLSKFVVQFLPRFLRRKAYFTFVEDVLRPLKRGALSSRRGPSLTLSLSHHLYLTPSPPAGRPPRAWCSYLRRKNESWEAGSPHVIGGCLDCGAVLFLVGRVIFTRSARCAPMRGAARRGKAGGVRG